MSWPSLMSRSTHKSCFWQSRTQASQLAKAQRQQTAILRKGHVKGDKAALNRAPRQEHAVRANFGRLVAALAASELVVPPSGIAQAVQTGHGNQRRD
eukprot:1459117-Prorocentrum_lima.AAC.1